MTGGRVELLELWPLQFGPEVFGDSSDCSASAGRRMLLGRGRRRREAVLLRGACDVPSWWA